MKKKTILIISSVILIAVIGALYLLSVDRDENEPLNNNIVSAYEPEFMNEEEKNERGLPTDSKIQVMKRNSEGETTIYKIIREESDVVTDMELINRSIDPSY